MEPLSLMWASHSIDKIKAIKDMKPATSVKELHIFLWIVNFYKQYRPRLSELGSCLGGSHQTKCSIFWSPKHQEAFEAVNTEII